MKDWIEKMKKRLSPEHQGEGNLYSPMPHVEYWGANSDTIYLEGDFSILQLEELVSHMRKTDKSDYLNTLMR